MDKKEDELIEIEEEIKESEEEKKQKLSEHEKKIFERERIGLEFYFKQSFIGKACDFFLGKKSPFASPDERRYEMGGGYSSPNFVSIVKLLTKMFTC